MAQYTWATVDPLPAGKTWTDSVSTEPVSISSYYRHYIQVFYARIGGKTYCRFDFYRLHYAAGEVAITIRFEIKSGSDGFSTYTVENIPYINPRGEYHKECTVYCTVAGAREEMTAAYYHNSQDVPAPVSFIPQGGGAKVLVGAAWKETDEIRVNAVSAAAVKVRTASGWTETE